MNPPLLSLLMPALASRVSSMRPLIEEQIAGHDDVELLIDLDDGQATSGEKRQRLSARARGTYLAFLDDDDEIAPEYLRAVLDGCRSGADVVTFDVELRNGKRPERWRLGVHRDDRALGRMAANHLCAWRASLARRVGWCPWAGYADDQLWYKPLLAADLARSEYHVHSVLYRYCFNAATTANQRRDRIQATKAKVGAGLRVFLLEDETIVVEEPARERAGMIRVRDPENSLLVVALSGLRPLTLLTVD